MKKNELREIMDFHVAYWRSENRERPLTSHQEEFEENVSQMRLADGSVVSEGMVLKPESISAEKLHPLSVIVNEENNQMPYIKGDLFRTICPYFKIPWIEAIVGCPIRVGISSNSIWAETHPNLSLKKIGSPSDLMDDHWLKKLIEIMKYLVRHFHGPYLITQTVIRGPTDMLDALIGTQRMVVEMHRQPNQIKKILEILSEVFIEVVKAQLDIIPPFNGGYCNFVGIWAPGKSVRVQEHASVVLSPRLYRKFVLPNIENISSQFDYTTFHTHTGMLHLEEKIAEIDAMDGIHISVDPEPFDLPLREILPKLANIQEKKPIVLDGEFTRKDIDDMLKRLPPDGLCIISRS